ncbi:MAG: PEP-CTERM sorting domain-containing protein [Pseudomonadota bacterium]
MRRFLITLTLALLSGSASAAVVQATFSGKMGDTFYTLADGTTQEAGFVGQAFTAVFTYDSDTMLRTQSASQDELRAGPGNGLPIGVHSVSLEVPSLIQPIVPTLFGNNQFTVQVHPHFMQHYVIDLSADGSANLIEFLFLGYSSGSTGDVTPPTDVLDAFDVSIPSFPGVPFPLVTGNFWYVVPASDEFDSYVFYGQLDAYSISIAVVPEPSTGWLFLIGLGFAGAWRTFRKRAAA